ncbi:MAG TPA: hypothetical protein VFQ53_36270 [Kofleriaceae bacterium]|nr:hypothetical protein [Kofleriaceae bacterium]
MRRAALLLALVAACGKSESSTKHEQVESAPVVKPEPPPAPEPATPKSTGPYSLAITPKTELAAGKPLQLELELRDGAGQRVRALDVVHEKLVHLIVVSNDLGFFTHEHPTRRDDGLLDQTLTLPSAGGYTVYADFTPTGGKNAVVSAELAIPGKAPPAVKLAPVKLPAEAKQGAFTVALRTEKPLAAGGDTLLDFEIRDANGVVTDLRDYLGAKGHCVILSADRAAYLHSHPMGTPDGKVRFHTIVPKPGTYKLWAEFRPRGEPLRVSFTLDVPGGTPGAAAGAAHHDHGDHEHSHK